MLIVVLITFKELSKNVLFYIVVIAESIGAFGGRNASIEETPAAILQQNQFPHSRYIDRLYRRGYLSPAHLDFLQLFVDFYRYLLSIY